jgi:hypothetical protein
MAYFSVLGGEGALAIVNDTSLGVGSAALGGGIEGPISYLFHGHGNRPWYMIGLCRRVWS